MVDFTEKMYGNEDLLLIKKEINNFASTFEFYEI